MTTDTEKFRTFIGIKLSETALAFIDNFKHQHSKDPWIKHIRWTAESNIHITMRFLGDLYLEQIQQIQAGLKIFLESQSVFTVTITSPQPFPSVKKARMLASLVHKNAVLQQIAEAMEALAVEAGVTPEERPFRGHITVGRFRKPVKGLEGLLAVTDTTTMPIDHVILFKSELKPTGAEYTEIAKFTLQPTK
ncbi:MAG: RNA 2',3'-cyclic phosphodiesterase [Gammaproteobacteria bacterium]|jgi:2'-5' RNA ligase